MNPVHLCIATGQNAANLIPLKQLEAPEVWILETPAMKALRSGNDLKTALGTTIEVRRIDFDDTTPQSIKREALSLASRLDGRDVVFHVTGGTKLMVLAIHEELKLLTTGSGSLRVLYADTQRQVLDWLDAEPSQEPMRDLLTLQDLLLVRGYRTVGDSRHAAAQQRAQARASLTREMGDNAAAYGRFFSALATVAGQARDSNYLHQFFSFPPGGHAAKLLELAAQSGLVHWKSGESDIAFADISAASYFAGDWAEEYVFLKMTGLFATGQFAINAKVTQTHTDTHNEIDAIVVCRNRALIMECKTGRQIKAQEAIYKLSQLVRQVGGLTAKGVYVSAQAVGEADRQRATEYGIEVLAADDLRKVNQVLRDWKGR